MQKILDGISLDFDDVLIRPKRSTLSSRSEVNIIRDFHFKHSPRKLSAAPIIVANMDTTGTFDMAGNVTNYGVLVALHKHYKPEELVHKALLSLCQNKVIEFKLSSLSNFTFHLQGSIVLFKYPLSNA